MLTRPRCRCAGRTGAHLVEFALVAPFFFLFIFALIDIGRGMMVTSVLSNAARSGCRTGVLPGKSNTDVQAAVNQALSSTGVAGTTVMATVNGKAVDVSTAATRDLVTVAVSVPVGSVTWLPVRWFVTGDLTARFSLEHE